MRRVLLAALLLPALFSVVEAQSPEKPLDHGRYQIVFSPHARADSFLLDTQTGTVWQFTKYTNLANEPMAWVVVPRIDNDMDMAAWALTQTLKPQPPSQAPPSGQVVKPR